MSNTVQQNANKTAKQKIQTKKTNIAIAKQKKNIIFISTIGFNQSSYKTKRISKLYDIYCNTLSSNTNVIFDVIYVLLLVHSSYVALLDGFGCLTNLY